MILLVQTNTLTEGATRIFETGRVTSEAVAASFDPLWVNVIQGSLYQAMADLGVLISVAALALFLVQWGQQLMSGEGDKAFAELIWPVIVIVLLSNDGALLGTTTLELRAIGNQVNNTILNSAVKGESLQDEFQKSRRKEAIDTSEATAISECLEKFPKWGINSPQQFCMDLAVSQANEQRQEQGLIARKSSNILRSAIQWLVRNLLWAIHSAFQYALEIVLIIIALLGPLAMGLTLVPGTGKALFSWLSGLASLFLMKLTLNLISGIAAYAVSQQTGVATSLLLPVLVGLIAPVLAVMVGLQGGNTFFNALSSSAVFMGNRAVFGYGKRGIKAALRQGSSRLRR